MDTAVVAPLLERTDFPGLLDLLNRSWREEQARRHAFREDLSEEGKAEFVNGAVVYHSPARARHLRACLNLAACLDAFVKRFGLGEVLVEKALVCLTRNDFGPDIAFFTADRARAFTPDQMEFPAPDFVVEVLSDSTEKTDRGVKFEDYAAHGVAEYWIVDPVDQSVEQYRLEGAAFRLHAKVREGLIHSLVVQGFDLPVAAIFDTEEQSRALRALLQ